MLKNKIIKHLTCNGKKETNYKILLKTLKKLQQQSLMQAKKLLNLSFIFIIPIFKINKLIKKGRKNRVLEIPSIINSNQSKIFLAIKLFLFSINSPKKTHFYIKFSKKIIENFYDEKSFTQLKNSTQKQALTKKHLFYYYKWK